MIALFISLFISGAEPARRQDIQDYLCKDIDRPFFQEEGDVMRPSRAQSNADSFSVSKPAGLTRVFVVGESAAGILGAGELQEKAAPGLEIINCGMGGYESYRVSGVINEILKYEPDMVVLLSGNNEGGPETCPGFFCELRRREWALKERFYAFLGRGGNPKIKASLKRHEARVRSMAAEAKKKGVPLVICALPLNYLMPPYGAAPLESVDFNKGRKAMDAGDHRLAFSIFSDWYKHESANPFAAYYAGAALYASGRVAESAEFLTRVPSLTVLQERTSPVRNTMLKRVAGEEGACLADLDAAFRKVSPGGVPGFEQFTDGVHWRSEYSDMVWDTIFSAAGACGIKAARAYGGAADGTVSGVERYTPEKRLSYAVFWMNGGELNEASVALLEQLIRKNPEIMGKAVRSADALGEVFISNFWSSGTAAGLGAVYPVFLMHAAEAYLRSGQPRTALELLVKLDKSGYSDWRPGLVKAKVLHALGRRAEAEAVLRRLAAAHAGGKAAFAMGSALGLSVPSPCATTSAGQVEKSRRSSDAGARLMGKGDLAGAALSFTDAYKADPYNIGALISLCVVYKNLGKAEAALQSCGRAVSVATDGCVGTGPAVRAQAAEAGALLNALKR